MKENYPDYTWNSVNIPPNKFDFGDLVSVDQIGWKRKGVIIKTIPHNNGKHPWSYEICFENGETTFRTEPYIKLLKPKTVVVDKEIVGAFIKISKPIQWVIATYYQLKRNFNRWRNRKHYRNCIVSEIGVHPSGLRYVASCTASNGHHYFNFGDSRVQAFYNLKSSLIKTGYKVTATNYILKNNE
jgi:hypothetical protein